MAELQWQLVLTTCSWNFPLLYGFLGQYRKLDKVQLFREPPANNNHPWRDSVIPINQWNKQNLFNIHRHKSVSDESAPYSNGVPPPLFRCHDPTARRWSGAEAVAKILQEHTISPAFRCEDTLAQSCRSSCSAHPISIWFSHQWFLRASGEGILPYLNPPMCYTTTSYSNKHGRCPCDVVYLSHQPVFAALSSVRRPIDNRERSFSGGAVTSRRVSFVRPRRLRHVTVKLRDVLQHAPFAASFFGPSLVGCP